MLRITEALLETDQKERARAIAQEALDLAFGNAVGKADRDLLVSFAPTISKAGLPDELLDAFRRLEERDVYISDDAFQAIAVSFAESGATDKALAVARGITSATNDGRARALAAISEVLHRAGREEEAEQVLTEALKTAQGIQFIAHRSWALHTIAPMLVRVGRSDEALLAVRDLVPGDNEPLGFVAVALVESRQWEKAKPAVVEVFASPRFENTVIRSGVLIALVEATLKTGRVEDALQLVELANHKLAKIQDPISRSGAFRRVAEAFAMVKKWDNAVDTAEKCEQQIDQLAAYAAIVREHSVAQGMHRKAVEQPTGNPTKPCS
jgi:tetratricopeptide (TPR) repeat protein